MVRKVVIIYSIGLVLFTVYLLLDTFVLEQIYVVVEPITIKNEDTGEVTLTDDYYEDDNITITISEYRAYDTTIYVADITLKDSSLLKTAFAKNTYGKNITEATSTIANNVGAILAINGDYYGVQENGYVLKNGVIYRDSAVTSREDLVIYEDGSMDIITEDEVSLDSLLASGAVNVLSFGPALIKEGEIVISSTTEVDKAMTSNPRTAIGITSDNHYLFIVSDGRTDESEGLTLYELALFATTTLNAKLLYNLDGGGSSTMVFNGRVINKPTTNGRTIRERSVSDIVYIGY